MNNEDWDNSNILGFCGASVQKLERMMLDVDDAKLLDQLNAAKNALIAVYRALKHDDTMTNKTSR